MWTSASGRDGAQSAARGANSRTRVCHLKTPAPQEESLLRNYGSTNAARVLSSSLSLSLTHTPFFFLGTCTNRNVKRAISALLRWAWAQQVCAQGLSSDPFTQTHPESQPSVPAGFSRLFPKERKEKKKKLRSFFVNKFFQDG